MRKRDSSGRADLGVQKDDRIFRFYRVLAKTRNPNTTAVTISISQATPE
jgi:hypothetical protein